MSNVYDTLDAPAAASSNPYDELDAHNPYDTLDKAAPLSIKPPPGFSSVEQYVQAGQQYDAGQNSSDFVRSLTAPGTGVPSQIGKAFQYAGNIPKAVLADVGTIGAGGLPSNTLAAFRGQPLPINQQIKVLNPAERAIYSGAAGTITSVPQLAATALAPEATPIIWGSTPQGFDPKQALLATALPVIGKYTGAITERLASKLGVSSDAALNILNRAGGASSAASLIGAQQASQIMQLPPEQRHDAFIDAVGNVASMAVLGGMGERGKIGAKTPQESPVEESANQTLPESETAAPAKPDQPAKPLGTISPAQSALLDKVVPRGIEPTSTPTPAAVIQKPTSQPVTAADVLSKGYGTTSPEQILNMPEVEYQKLVSTQNDEGTAQWRLTQDATRWAMNNPDADVGQLKEMQKSAMIRMLAALEKGDGSMMDRTQWFGDAIHALNKTDVGLKNIASAENKQAAPVTEQPASPSPVPATSAALEAGKTTEVKPAISKTAPTSPETQASKEPPATGAAQKTAPAAAEPLGINRPAIQNPSLANLSDEQFDAEYRSAKSGVDIAEKGMDSAFDAGRELTPQQRKSIGAAQDRWTAVSLERFKRNTKDTVPEDLFYELKNLASNAAKFGPESEAHQKARIILDELKRQGATPEQMMAGLKLSSPDAAEVFKADLEDIKKIITEIPAKSAKPASPIETLNTAKSVTIKAPKEATMVRVTDSDGKTAIQDIKSVQGENVFQGADIKKIEAGTIGKNKQFIPVKGSVVVEPKMVGMGGAAKGEVESLPTIEDQISGKQLAPVREPKPEPFIEGQNKSTINGFSDAVKSGIEKARGWLGGMAGKTFPKTTLLSRQLGELGARWISSKIAARPKAELFAAEVLGDSGLSSHEVGAALTEDNSAFH